MLVASEGDTALAYSKEEKVLKNLHGNLQTFQYFDTSKNPRKTLDALPSKPCFLELFFFFFLSLNWGVFNYHNINGIKSQVHGMRLPVVKSLFSFLSLPFFLIVFLFVCFSGTHTVVSRDHFHYSN